MAETLQNLSIISFAVAGVCLVLTIFFLFFFNIPTVIGDLSGRTAKKSIAKMRVANEKTGIKSYKGSKINAERGKLTGTMPDFDNPGKKKEKSENERPETGILSENQINKFESEATGILDVEATGLLVDEDETAPLNPSAQNIVKHRDGKKLTMLNEIVFIHTDEIIE